MCEAYLRHNNSGKFIECDEQILDLSQNGYARLISVLRICVDEGRINT